MAIDITHKFLKSILSMEYSLTCIATLIWAQVSKGYLYACIEESKFPHSTLYDIPLIYRCSKYCAIRPELLARSSFCCFPNYFNRIQRLTLLIFLLVYLSITENLRFHPG